MGRQTSAGWGMRQNHSPDGTTAAAFFVGVIFRVSIRKLKYNYVILFSMKLTKYYLLPYILVIWIRKLLTKERISYLTGTYLNFQLEEFLAWFRIVRVCQRQLGILVKICQHLSFNFENSWEQIRVFCVCGLPVCCLVADDCSWHNNYQRSAKIANAVESPANL